MKDLQNIIDRKIALIEAKQEALKNGKIWEARILQEEIEELETILLDNKQHRNRNLNNE